MKSLSVVWSLFFFVSICIGYTCSSPIGPDTGYLSEHDIDPMRLIQALNERELAAQMEDYSMHYPQEHIKVYAPKRSPFSAWGGKRSDEDFSRQIRREQFSAWGGKRQANNWVDMIKAHLDARARRAPITAEVARANRASFSAWGGK